MKRLFLFVAMFILIYEASAQEWVNLSLMPSAKSRYSAAQIKGTDQAIIFGGTTGSVSDETWLYDNSENVWTKLEPANKPNARYAHAMCAIDSGRVLLFGGYSGSVRYSDTWIFDISDSSWTELSPSTSPLARTSPMISYMGDGLAMMFGGSSTSILDDTWLFNLDTEEWTELNPATNPSGRYSAGMDYAGGSRAVLFGGYRGDDDDDTWVFDLADTSWTRKYPTTAPSGRRYHDMAYVGDDKIILFGGWDGSRDNETWVYDVSDSNWTEITRDEKPSARTYPALCSIDEGKIFLFGGNDGAEDNETWVYDFSNEEWENKKNQPDGRCKHDICNLGNNMIILFGGKDGGLKSDTWIYDQSNNFWTFLDLDESPSAREYLKMCQIGENKILLFGGSYKNDTWVFDLDSLKWENKNPLNKPSGRNGHGLAYLGDDKALFFGGSASGHYVNDTWLYDLSENNWTQLTPLNKPAKRGEMALCNLSDGKVIMFGGDDYGVKNDSWIFELSDSNWHELNIIEEPTIRYAHRMELLNNGEVILFGGAGNGYTPKSDTWKFNLSDTTWTELNLLSNPNKRYFHSMATLNNGQIFIHGGVGESEDLSDYWIISFPIGIPELITPDSSSTDKDTSLTFTWHKSDLSTTYQLQLSEDAGFTSLIADTALSDTTFSIGGLDFETEYFWRVMGVYNNRSGDWSGVWNFTTKDKLLLVSPADSSDYLDITGLEFILNNVNTALTYKVQISEDTSFNSLALDTAISDTSFTFDDNFDYSSTYYWRAKAENASDTSNWSEIWMFSTKAMPLTIPQVISPADSSEGLGIAGLELLWDFQNDADSYYLQLADNPSFNGLIIDTVLADTSVLCDNFLEYSMDYFWRVSARKFMDTTGWSETRLFSTMQEPLAIPQITTPTDSSEGYELTDVIFAWASVPNADNYRFQLSGDFGFSSFLIDTVLTDTTITFIDSLDYSSAFHCRVRAFNSIDTSDWSDIITFSTKSQINDVPSNWSYSDLTGNSATIIVPTSINPQLIDRSFENGDAIGFFFLDSNGNEKCAGYEKWTGVNLAITAWGDNDQTEEKDGFDEFEDYLIKIWDAQTGTEYYSIFTFSTGESYFTKNGYSIVGSLEAISAQTQDIALIQGWNMISSNIVSHEKEMPAIWNGQENELKVLKNGEGKVFIPSFEINSIGNWNIEHAYQAFMTTSDTLSITGIPVQPENKSVSMIKGWNMTAYLRQFPMSAPTALQTLVSDTALQLVKNNEGKVYVPEFGINTIGDLKPGQGYQLMLTKASTLTYPSNSASRATTSNAYPVAKNLIPEHSITGKDFTALVSVEVQSGSEVGIYNSNNELIGSGVVMNGIAPVTVWGDNEKTQIIDGALADEGLSLKVLEDGKLIDLNVGTISSFITDESIQNLTFKKDEFIMIEVQSIENADIILNVSPNPVKDEFRMDFTLANEGIVSIRIFSLTGELIKTITPQFYNSGTFTISENLEGIPAGEYNIVVEQNGRQAIEMIIKRK